MKFLKLIFLIGAFVSAACGGGPGSTPDSIAQVKYCHYGYGGYMCDVIFDDGQPGYTATGFNGQTYICKGAGCAI